ncbi:MAG: DUF2239 family protein [Verrucomicrobiota bacterium]
MTSSEIYSPAADEQTWSAFFKERHLFTGNPSEVVEAVKRSTKEVEAAGLLIFDNATGRTVEPDPGGSPEAARARPAPASESGLSSPDIRGRGRPKLGVVAREVTLLPRHWAWLGEQPGGASVALRKLVETARTENAAADRKRRAGEAAYRFMTTMAGNQPGYEEAIRALFAGDSAQFDAQMDLWPPDIRNHTQQLARPVFSHTPKIAS